MSSRGAGRSVLAYVVLALAYFDGAVAQAPLQNSPAPSADNSERLACGQQWDRLGDFSCDRDNSQRQTICGCRPPLFDNSSAWIYLGVIEDKECYSHVTGMSCGDTNLLRKAILACSSNWQTSGSLTCDNSGMERQTICECSPPGADNPALWMKEGGGCYSHLTGRSCSNPGRVMRGIWDLVQKDGTWRTDFNDPSAGTIQRPITLAPCTFNIDDPHTLYAGPIYRNESTGELICDLSSKTYESSNASTSSVQWPTDNFWVVHANNELAFGREDPCSDGGANSGPPGQSKPVSVPGQAVFGFEYVNSDLPVRKKALLALDTNKFPNCVSPIDKGKIPFISFGLQTDRGAGAFPITYLNDPLYPDILKFSATIEDIAPDGVASSSGKSRANFSYVFFEANWNEKRRWIFVSLLTRHPDASDPMNYSASHWNWNVAESMWAGGAEIVFISAKELKALCPQGALSVASLSPTIGSSQDYAIRLSETFRCISQSGRVSWSDPFPTTPVRLTGVHWAIEMAFGKNWQKMSVQTIDLTR